MQQIMAYMQQTNEPAYRRMKVMAELMKPHSFWDTQPVPNNANKATMPAQGAIDTEEDVKKVEKKPFSLPEGFEWSNIDLTNDDDAE